MVIKVNWRDDHPATTYENVGAVKMLSICYLIINQNDEMIANIPIDVVRSIEAPGNDSKLLKV